MSRIVKTSQEVILADYSSTVILTDYVLRWLSLGFYRILYGNEGGHLGVFFSFQVIITLLTVAYAFYRDYRFRKSIDQEATKDESIDDVISFLMKGLNQPTLYETLGSSVSVMVRIVLLLTFCVMILQVVLNIQSFDIAHLLDSRDKPSAIGITFTVTFFVYGMFLLFISSMSIPSVSNDKIEANLSKQARNKPQQTPQNSIIYDPTMAYVPVEAQGISSETIVDSNDIAIVEMEGDIRNLQNRVEAYILESVMFGALSFSGFLTLLAADEKRVDYELMSVFGDSIKKILFDILLLKFDFSDPAYHILLDGGDDRRFLITWIMFVTLMGSLFFILVIASRLKFSNIIEKVDNTIRLARTYNDKEEEVFILHLQFEDKERLKQRLELLSRKIAQQITMATELLKEVQPVVYYMSIFRNLGVFFCLMIIMLGLLFYSQVLTMLVGILAFFVYVYKRVDDWYRRNRLKSILQRNRDIHYS